MKNNPAFAAILSILVAGIGRPPPLHACSCGADGFQVGTSAQLPTRDGWMISLSYDGVDQKQNWTGSKRGDGADNADKRIQSDFMTAGVRYMFSREWGLMAEAPYANRYFKTTTDAGDLAEFRHSSVGDIRINGIYSGFSPDMSTGLTLGLKLPTGDFHYAGFDRDTQIGTGSTDLLLGAYHMGQLPAASWKWFSQAQLDAVALIGGGYRPGSETSLGLGAYYNGWSVGPANVAAVAHATAAHRWRDSGALAKSQDTGSERLNLAPGIELDALGYRLYGEAAFPVYYYVNGNQLIPSTTYKVSVGYSF